METKEWKKRIRKVTPYVPGEQPKERGLIKLNTNENPYPPSPKVEKRLLEMDYESLKLYPDPDAKELVKELAVYHQLNENQVFVGVGSDDVLAMSFLTFFNSGKPVLFPDVTYSFYEVWADLYHIPYERPPLDEDFRIKKEDYYKENGGIVIANPNAPTSIGEGKEFIRDLMEHNSNSLVIVDEAYVDFGGESALELVNAYDNLLVVRTFSKSRSMAGARIGYAIGHPFLIRSLMDVKNSYNSYPMNQLSVSLGVESLKDDAYFKERIEWIIRTRENTKRELINKGFQVLDSQTNFLFASHKEMKAFELFNRLRDRGILVRHFRQNRIDNYLRITIGSDEEMKRFVQKMKDCLEG